MQDAMITLTGNLGSDVEFTHGTDWAVARFRLACTPRRLRQGIWVDQETTWIQVNAWGRTAENLRDSLAKGDPVVVTGKLRTSAWQSSDGARHERLVVEANAVGHDLTRGTATFVRNPPRVVTELDGTRVNATTGEVLDRDAPMPFEPVPDDEVVPDPADEPGEAGEHTSTVDRERAEALAS